MAKMQNKNAVTHGMFSKTIILPGENIKEFEKLYQSLVQEWRPEGPTESDRF